MCNLRSERRGLISVAFEVGGRCGKTRILTQREPTDSPGPISVRTDDLYNLVKCSCTHAHAHARGHGHRCSIRREAYYPTPPLYITPPATPTTPPHPTTPPLPLRPTTHTITYIHINPPTSIHTHNHITEHCKRMCQNILSMCFHYVLAVPEQPSLNQNTANNLSD
jgi:hypothetical protein